MVLLTSPDACPSSPAPDLAPRDIPQQPSSLLVAGEELGADSIKDDAQIAPAQAIPQPLVPRPSTRAGTVQIANPNILTLTPTLTLILTPTLTYLGQIGEMVKRLGDDAAEVSYLVIAPC